MGATGADDSSQEIKIKTRGRREKIRHHDTPLAAGASGGNSTKHVPGAG